MWRTTDKGLLFLDYKPLRRALSARASPRCESTFPEIVDKPGEEAVGNVAVPAARVHESSSEEGWYEIRSRDGSLVTGDEVGVDACV